MDSSKNNVGKTDDSSIGILSMENLKVFGDSMCSNTSNIAKNSHTIDRLNKERMKALAMLEKPMCKFVKGSSNKENSKPVHSSTCSRKLDQTEYVPFNRPNSINLSELISDETINLNSWSSIGQTPASKESKISFEPTEMTGRSTIYNCEEQKSKTTAPCELSVGEILESCVTEKARNLSQALKTRQAMDRGSTSLSRSSFFAGCNDSRSLPRTADMSQSNTHHTAQFSFNGGDGFSFSQQQNSSFISAEEDFMPAEIMQSKLILDEISWAEEFAAIPSAALSEMAKIKASNVMVNDIDTSVSNSMLAADPDFSVGNYFNMRSENIDNIVKGSSPSKERTPMPLTETGDTTIVSTTDTELLVALIDNKTYTKADSNIKHSINGPVRESEVEFQSEAQNHNITCTASTNTTEDSYMLSLTAIDRALNNMVEDSENASTDNVVKKLLKYSKKLKSPGIAIESEPQIIQNASDDNKENRGPSLNKNNDTLSFSETLLNSSEFDYLRCSCVGDVRIPLSPLSKLAAPQIQIIKCDGNDADIDEYPSTPVISPNRRVRRTKSPNFMSPTTGIGNAKSGDKVDQIGDGEEKTPVNRAVHSQGRPKSLCSTRLDGEEFGTSPNFLKSTSTTLDTLTQVRSSLQLNNMCRNSREDRSSGRATAVTSPIASPRSCVSSPATSVISSSSSVNPVGYGALRKCVSSSSSNGAIRSVSRCSNSSEFSHRDGKVIPLKVTQLELCWGSTKLRTDVRKSMQVKNTASKRLVVRIGIHGPGFQLVSAGSNTLTLQSQECRLISINFCPTVVGVAVGTLSFYSPIGTTNSNTSFLEIPLYGYGGNASVSVHGLLKGPIGACFLQMGDVCELAGPLESTFSIYNKGPLQAYACISVDSETLMKPRLCEAFEVTPSIALIPPGTEIVVRIVFRPRREDIKKIRKKIAGVMTLANMRIICGDEPNRQRMRAIVQRMQSAQRAKFTSTMLDLLWCKFTGEQEVQNLAVLKEQTEAIIDFITAVRIHEVALTLNRDLDESAESTMLFLPEADETLLFRTVCATNSPTLLQQNFLDPVDELLETNNTINSVNSARGGWTVNPECVEFDLRQGARGTERTFLLIRNYYGSRQYFEATCNYAHVLDLTPSTGYLAPDGGHIEMEVRVLQDKIHDLVVAKQDILIMIYIENERITVPVKIYK